MHYFPAKLFNTELKRTILILLLLLPYHFANSQNDLLFVPREINAAIKAGSRSPYGTPGKNYFQNRVDYDIDVEYFPDTRFLKGTCNISYTNNSPFDLNHLVIRLYQNIFLKGGIRGRAVDPEDVHHGVKINSIIINGKDFDPLLPLYKTQTVIAFPFGISPGKKASIVIDWEFYMPAKTTNRFGCYGDSSCFIAYWFPQVSVFDDINGWDLSDYTGVAEFYNEYGDFLVNVSVPQNFIVWATGELVNPENVLQKEYLDKYNRAKISNEIVHIIDKKDLRKNSGITKKGKNTWKYHAINVSDFAFAVSNTYQWDATSVEIGGKSGAKKRVLIETAYNRASENFRDVAEIAAWSVKEYSDTFPGIDYPYPKLTIFNGRGGMEFPMIKNNGESNPKGTLFVTTHEIGHSYFPFLVGTNQKKHGWFDEGLVTMIAQEQYLLRDTSLNYRHMYNKQYPLVAGTEQDVPPLVNSNYLTDEIFQVHDYMRPSLAFWILRDIMGDDVFRECIAGFIEKWNGKHPTPWDFFNLTEHISGMELGWFFYPWFGRFAYPDLKISEIIVNNSITDIILENAGGMPFPSKLKINFSDDSSEIHDLPATIWKNSTKYSFKCQNEKTVRSAEIITEGFPDVNIENNYLEN